MSTISTFVGFKENIKQFIPQTKTTLKGESLVTPSIIIPSDNV
jgi:hypothetical protein